jgi:hypothetical protein
MSDFSTPLPSGLRVRHIQTTTVVVAGKPVVTPVLDARGQEIELYAVAVPLHLEGADSPRAARAAAIDAFVQDIQAKGPELALVRAAAVLKGTDPAVAETAFTTAQRAGNVAAEVALGDAIVAPPGGLT